MTTRGEPCPCPYCGAALDGATVAVAEKEIMPEAGDWSVCLYCARLLVFTGVGVAVRKPTDEEAAEGMADEGVRRAISVVKKYGPRDPGRRRTAP